MVTLESNIINYSSDSAIARSSFAMPISQFLPQIITGLEKRKAFCVIKYVYRTPTINQALRYVIRVGTSVRRRLGIRRQILLFY